MVSKAHTPRARAPHQKQARREILLALAEDALQETPYAEITMAALAARAGLAKGTLYLSYPTKEALFLDLAQQSMEAWLEALGNLDARSAKGFARQLAACTAARPGLRTLLSLLHGILEQNIPEETAFAFKQAILARWQRLAAHIEPLLSLEPGRGMPLLLQIYALLLGFQPLCEHAPVVRALLHREEMAPYRLDFETCFADAVERLLRGHLER